MLNEIITGEEFISVIGLGYVGLPLAVAFAEKGVKIIAFDINEKKIELYKNGYDLTNEVGNERLKKLKNINFTTQPSELKKASFHIIAVPTPVLKNKMPDLKLLESASILLGKNMNEHSIVVYESTVFPGVTEEYCVPILERESNLKCGIDFKVGYSPERINPGDKKHRIENIVKVVSGMDEDSLELISSLYEVIITAGVYRAKSIKVAEAAKVIENSQRDINIAFVNELSLIFDKMGLDTQDVLKAAGTKWNFLNFTPGLVGGHCIGVDPYYLSYKAEQLGYHARVILSGRRINDSMGKFIAEKTVKKMIDGGKRIKNSTVLIMGLTFKENCSDLRNTKVVDILNELKEYGIKVIVTDYFANEQEAFFEYGIEMEKLKRIKDVDAVVIAVAHDDYKKMDICDFKNLYRKEEEKCILIDVKGILNKEELGTDIEYWRL